MIIVNSDAYRHVKVTITITNTGAAEATNNTNKNVIFKNCTPFTDYISKINNTQVDNPKDIYAVKPMYNSVDYSDIYSKKCGSLR